MCSRKLRLNGKNFLCLVLNGLVDLLDGLVGKLLSVDMFEDDQELKEQARLARLKKEEEEKEARAAAKEAERLRKQKEKEEKERRKREAGPSWIQRKIDSLTKEIFSDDDMK